MAKLFNTNVLSREELDDIANGGAGQAGPIEDQVIDDTNAEEAQVTQEEIEEEIITPQTVITLVQKYRPNACEIRSFKDNTGTIELAEHYHLEGV